MSSSVLEESLRERVRAVTLAAMTHGAPAASTLDPGVWVSLSGDAMDLEEVAKLFSESHDPRVGREADTYFVSEAGMASLPDDVAKRNRAVEVVELINGAGSLEWTNHHPLSVGGRVVTITEDGSRSESQVVMVSPAISRSRAMGVAVVIGGTPVQQPPPAPPRWVQAAFHDDDVAATLRILADPDVAWGRLYHVFDLVEADIGSGIRQWATRAECNRFTHTANSRLALGDDARHGHTRHQAPASPMTIGEARQLIHKIVAGWLQARVP
jgi:hypothetical protein